MKISCLGKRLFCRSTAAVDFDHPGGTFFKAASQEGRISRRKIRYLHSLPPKPSPLRYTLAIDPRAAVSFVGASAMTIRA
jgi:hypothetical protein